MTDPAADAARSAAAILALDLGPNLPAEVEAALAARDTQQRPDRYFNPVSLASLIVAIATLAWTIYTDQRIRTPDPPPSSIARRVRILSATRTRPCLSTRSASPKWSLPRSSARPTRPVAAHRTQAPEAHDPREKDDAGRPRALPAWHVRIRASGLKSGLIHQRSGGAAERRALPG